MNLAKEFGHDFGNGNFYLVDKDNMLVYTEFSDGGFVKKKYFSNGRIKYVLQKRKGSCMKILFNAKGDVVYRKVEEGRPPNKK